MAAIRLWLEVEADEHHLNRSHQCAKPGDALAHRWTEAGKLWEVTWELSPA